MLAMKEPCRFMPWNAAGVSLYSGQVVTTQANLAKDKELCRAVTEALTEGLAFALKDPEAGVDIFMKESAGTGRSPRAARKTPKSRRRLMHYTVMSKEAADAVDRLYRYGEGRRDGRSW